MTTKVVEYSEKIVNTVIETINQGIYFALQTFELDVDVKVNPKVSFKV